MAETKRLLRVFLCHSSSDKPAVRQLYRRLSVEGWIDPWLDEEKLLPGMDWDLEIERAVEATDVVIVCLSNNSINKEGYVQKEIRKVLDVSDLKPDGTIFVIPLRLENCEVPKRLNRWQWVDYFPKKQKELAYKRLLVSLQKRAESLDSQWSETRSIVGAPELEKPKAKHFVVTLPEDESGKEVTTNPVDIGFSQSSEMLINAMSNSNWGTPEIEIARSHILKETLEPLFILNNKRLEIGGLEFMYVPAGKFVMGSNDENELASDAEKPQHSVNIPYDYWIAKFILTNEQYAQFLDKQKHPVIDWEKKKTHPVVNVSWDEASTYCRWFNETYQGELKAAGNLTVRLPTEAEWEKAARGVHGNEWPWGSKFDPNKCNSLEGKQWNTTSVGLYSSVGGDSPYGCADMAGNVWEWTHSLFAKYPYEPKDGRENEANRNKRVLRGGSFYKYLRLARAAYRDFNFPDAHSSSTGFRLVASPIILS